VLHLFNDLRCSGGDARCNVVRAGIGQIRFLVMSVTDFTYDLQKHYFLHVLLKSGIVYQIMSLKFTRFVLAK